MLLKSKKGISGLALVVLIVIILAVIILIVFITPIRSIVITDLAGIGKSIGLVENGTQTTGGGGGNNALFFQNTNFTAYNCSGPSSCVRFTDNNLLWYVNFNSVNLSENITKNITFSSHPGNYIYKLYNFTLGSTFYYSNVSLRTATAGSTYNVYYFFS